ncbi:MAG: site-specific integrase [Acidimicrobiales bacterium]
MKGYMRQRGGSWELRVFLGHDPVTGKQRYANRTVRGGKREAQRALAAMITEAEQGLTARSAATVAELLEAWFDQAAPDFSPATAKETRGYLDRSLLPGLGGRRLAKLKPGDIDAFYRRLRESGGVGGKPLAPATVRRIHGILRRALAQGVRWGWIGVNPAASASPPKVPAPKVAPPDPEQLARLLARARDESPDFACFVLVAAATGARRSELVALRWDDVDQTEATLDISRGIVVGRDGLVEKDTKTHSSRRVSLDAQTAAVLAEHREQMAARAQTCGVDLADDAFVFSNAPDCTLPWFPGSVSRSFKRLCEKEGIAGVRLHDLRHFVATQLLGAGVDVRTVAGRLGHRNAATTLNVYAHFLEQSDRAAADVIGNLISGSDWER